MSSAAALRIQIESALRDRIPSALTPVARSIRPVFPTGIVQLDQLLEGGLPLGAITEIVGPESSGRTSLALSFLAGMTQAAKVCAWIDVSDALDPESAAASGVDLNRLLWVRCGVSTHQPQPAPTHQFALPDKYLVIPKIIKGLHGGGHGPHPRTEVKGLSTAVGELLRPEAMHCNCADPQRRVKEERPTFEPSLTRIAPKPLPNSYQGARPTAKPWSRISQALRVTDLILQAGGFSSIVLDMSSLAPEHASRVSLATWFRYRAAAERTQASFLLLTQHACAKSSAGLLLRMQPGQPRQQESTVFTGLKQHIEIQRERFTPLPNNVIPLRKPPLSERGTEWQTRTPWAWAKSCRARLGQQSMSSQPNLHELYACLYVREFPAQAMLRLRPALHNQPCAVMEGAPPLEQVCALNAKARTLGVTHGMTRVEVDTFPSLTALSRSALEESSARATLLECAGTFSPRVQIQQEANSFLCVIDIAGTEKLYGSPSNLSKILYDRVKTLGFSASIAICSNYHAAVCLARGMYKRQISVVAGGTEAAALAPLPIAVLSLSEDHSTTLHLWGVHTLGMLAALPEKALIARLGQAGKRLRELASGQLPHLFLPVEPAFSLEETIELDTPVELLESLLFILGIMLEQLILRATAHIFALASVTVTLTLEGNLNDPSPTHTRTVAPALPNNDRATWLKLLHLDLEAHPPDKPILALTLTAVPGTTSKVQFGLFSPQLPEPMRLDVTLARIRAIVGEDHVGRAVLKDKHHPDSFHMEPFRLTTETIPTVGRRGSNYPNPHRSPPTKTARNHLSYTPRPTAGILLFPSKTLLHRTRLRSLVGQQRVVEPDSLEQRNNGISLPAQKTAPCCAAVCFAT